MKAAMHKRQAGLVRSSILLLGCAPFAVFGGSPGTQPALPVAPVAAPIAAQVGSGPATRPSEDGGGHKAEHPGNGEESPHGHNRPGQHPIPQINANETDEAMTFMKAHSPKRYAAWESLPDTPRKQRIKNVFAAAFAQMSRTPKDDPLYKNGVSRVETEDEIYGIVTDLHKEPAEKQEAIKAQLREKVKALVAINLEERQLRLEKLQNTVERERKALANDQANRDSLVNSKMNEIANDERSLGAGMGGGARGRQGPRQGDPNPPQQ